MGVYGSALHLRELSLQSNAPEKNIALEHESTVCRSQRKLIHHGGQEEHANNEVLATYLIPRLSCELVLTILPGRYVESADLYHLPFSPTAGYLVQVEILQKCRVRECGRLPQASMFQHANVSCFVEAKFQVQQALQRLPT